MKTIPVRTTLAVLALIVLTSGVVTALAMRRNSTTFDEIVFVAAGARGLRTGNFDMVPDHPPLPQYIYGLPAVLAGANPADEAVDTSGEKIGRYTYAQRFFWHSGNDPERLAFVARLPAVLMAMLLVLVTFAFTRRHGGDGAALLAAALVAFLPDILAHGGVAYSDLPVTLGIFAAAWAIDETVRAPHWRRGLVAGLLAGLALGMKISAIALAPLALALVAVELLARRRDGRLDAAWLRGVAGAALVSLVALYAVIVIIYRGDFLLEQFRYGFSYRFRHFSGGHQAYAFLLGERSTTGWWYFFPVAFLLKTSAALHALLLIAVVALLVRARRTPAAILTSGLRVPALGILVFGAVLLSSSLNIGFRYAMPLLPWVVVLAAVGAHMATQLWRRMKLLVPALAMWAAGFSLSYYPNFLTFISEYGPGRDRNYTVLIDSSMDWGQGLLQLRDFMREQGIPIIHLSYFGSADPAGYGIDHVPMPSAFPLPERPGPAPDPPPQWAAISATNIQGIYIAGDPFSHFRAVAPHAVVANSILLYYLPLLGE